MVRKTKRLGSRKNTRSRKNKMSRRKFRGGGFWDMFSSKKPEEVAQLPDRDQVSPQEAPVNPVGVNADYEPSQEEIEKAHQTLMLASKSGMSGMNGGSRRKKYRRRR